MCLCGHVLHDLLHTEQFGKLQLHGGKTRQEQLIDKSVAIEIYMLNTFSAEMEHIIALLPASAHISISNLKYSPKS